MATFHEVMTSFIWYSVEFLANIAVIWYVAQKAGFVGAPRMVKQDVPATLQDTLKGTAGFVTNLTDTVKAARAFVSSATGTDVAPTPPSTPVVTPVSSVRPGGRK